MTKGAGYLNEGEMGNDNSSRIEPKRSHRWFTDGPETVFFPNKKQSVGVPTTNLYSEILNSNVSPWENASSFHSISGQFAEQLFDSETARSVNYDDQNIQSVSTEKVDMRRKVSEDLFTNDSLFGLSKSHTLEDPRSGLNYGGIRKVKVSQVKDSENVMVVSMEHAYDTVDNNSVSTVHAYNKVEDGKISIGLAYDKWDENIMCIGDTYERENNVFMSMGQSYNKTEDSITTGQTYKESNNANAMSNTFDNGDDYFMSMGQTYNRTDDSFITVGHTYGKGDDSGTSISHSYSKGEYNNLSIGQSYGKGESIISFGGYGDDDDTNPLGRLILGYELLMGQPSVQRCDCTKCEKVG